MEAASAPPEQQRQVVFMHVGAPKTGTTFLQDVMWHHRKRLADDGILFTRERYGDHFQATIDLRRVKPLRPSSRAARGTWSRVAQRARSWPGTSVISHEMFAPTRPRQIRRALHSLQPAEVHIVYTVRDLWRQLPAEWQESTKHGRTFSFEEFLDDVIGAGRNGRVGKWFWSVHDVLDVLGRWGRDLPPDRVHVVTVPRPGSDPGLLWRRYAAVIGIEPERFDIAVARSNASLGAAEVGFLRRVNAAVAGRLSRRQRLIFVKGLLAQRILVAGRNKTPIGAPPERFAWAQAKAEEFIAGIEAAGYDVVGDLDELRPLPPPNEPYLHPDDVAVPDLVRAGVDAIVGLALHMGRMRQTRGVGGTQPVTPRPTGRLRAVVRARATARLRRVPARLRRGRALQAVRRTLRK